MSEASSLALILDPVEREEFKRRQPGLRREDGTGRRLPLPPPGDAAEWEARLAARRTCRRFAAGPVPAADLGRLLACLCPLDDAGEVKGVPKYLYPSAGALYPVQTYVHLRPGQVVGLDGGAYYHDPTRNRLIELTPAVDLDPALHTPLVNRPVFATCAFSLFLVAELAAIGPMYGADSLPFSRLEAGYMGQLLMTMAPRYGLGLCPIGGLDFDRIRHLFQLGGSHVLVHSFLGGRPEAGAPYGEPPIEEASGSGTAGGATDREEGAI
jgi:SagB-type dehydrogenase family enzyme